MVRFPNFSFTHQSLSATLRTNQSATADPRAEELVRPHRLAAVLAVDDGERREGSAARGAPAQQLPPALRAGLGHIRLEFLEPPPRRPTAEAKCDPVSEDLPTLFPQPIRRLRHVLTIAVSVAAVAGCGGGAQYQSARRARVVHFTLHSQ